MRPPIDTILDAAAEAAGLDRADMLARNNRRWHARARAACAVALRRWLGMSWPEVGRALGGRPHCTPLSAAQRYACDPAVNDLVAKIDARLTGRYDAAREGWR